MRQGRWRARHRRHVGLDARTCAAAGRIIGRMFEWADDLKIQGIELYMDSRQTRQTCFVSHAHTDHIGIHEMAITTAETAALAEQRLGVQGVRELAYGESVGLDADTVIKLLPAGHVLGS